MSVMCSLAVCKAQQGMCGHEKVMLSVAMLAVTLAREGHVGGETQRR